MTKKPTSLTVRLGEDLLQQVRISAAHNSHSMNAEIVRLLNLALRENPPGTIHTSQTVPALSEEESEELIRLFAKAHMRGRGK